MLRLIHVNIYKNIYKAVQFFVLPSSHEEFSCQFEYILPISALDVRIQECHILMVQGFLLKEGKLPNLSKGVNSELHETLNTGEFVF